MPGEYRKTELINGVVVTTHVVDDSHDGWRADNYLRTQYKYFSRNRLQNLIDDGRIVMPNKRLKAATTLHSGDLIRVITEETSEPCVDAKYKIIYEDAYLIVIDKPGNLPVHPAGKFLFNTLLMALRKDRVEWLTKGHDFFLIHRLDRETSGVILLAKTREMAGMLVKEFRERRTDKRYWAVTSGHCKEESFSVDADIGSAKNSPIRLKMAAFPKGQGELASLTHFKVLRRGNGVDLVDCKLMTGRQHQIRVNLAYAGVPIVGDKLYGKHAEDGEIFLNHIYGQDLSGEQRCQLVLERHALHSRYLKFFHSPLNKWVEVESPLPKDMEHLLL